MLKDIQLKYLQSLLVEEIADVDAKPASIVRLKVGLVSDLL
jgi:hypothetical protein